jgi:hypothetical protein
MKRRVLRSMTVLAGTMLATILAAQPASAAQVLSSTGSPGHYKFNDSMQTPGIQCYYGHVNAANQDLKKIDVHGPRLWARNSTSGRDTQTVGWRYIIQHSQAGGDPPWETYHTSALVKATTHDDVGYKFPTQTWIAPPDFNVQWRVKLALLWYTPGSSTTVSGSVRLLDEYAIITYPPNPDIHNVIPCLPGQ